MKFLYPILFNISSKKILFNVGLFSSCFDMKSPRTDAPHFLKAKEQQGETHRTDIPVLSLLGTGAPMRIDCTADLHLPSLRYKTVSGAARSTM